MSTNRRRRRQSYRQALIIISLLLFPITINYLSPYLIIDGASQGVINGSFISFTLMFLSALFVGRLWCGWACPGAGIGEVARAINDKPAPGGRWDWIKYGIWVPWLAAIILAVISAGGYRRVNPLHMMDSFISVDRPEGYVIYYVVVSLFLGLAVFAGRRGGCHYICWMAPFMVIGRKTRNLFRWPSLRLKAEAQNCIDCKRCERACPMSLPVNGLVRRGDMEHSECILCGSCVDTCPKSVIRYSFSAGRGND